MFEQVFENTKQLEFERSYAAPLATVWRPGLAAFGMKWGYKARLDELDKLLATA